MVYQNGAFKQYLVNGMLKYVGHPEYNMTYIRNEAPGAFWDGTDITGHYDRVAWPAVHVGGWYDIFLRDTLQVFEHYRTRAQPGVRDLQFLMLQPTGHCFGGGAVDWGPAADLPNLAAVVVTDLVFGMLRGATTPAAYELRLAALRLIAQAIPRVIWYVMGPGLPGTTGNYVTAAHALPSPVPMPMYLGPGGALSPTSGMQSAVASYLYDPRDPVATLGGNLMGMPPHMKVCSRGGRPSATLNINTRWVVLGVRPMG